jgi:DMSO reductase family type II enzyme chaperone
LHSRTTGAAIRGALYTSLARGFRYPTAAMFGAFRDGDYLTQVWERIAALPHLAPVVRAHRDRDHDIRDALARVEFLEFESAFVRTFDVEVPAPPAPPYEGVYRAGDRSATMLQVSEFYRHFGLEVSREEGTHELPDHLAVELEFLHFLTFKEAQATRERRRDLLDGYRRAQRDFLERHLAEWVPAFCDRLAVANAAPFYDHLAGITRDVLHHDHAWLASSVRPAARG